MQKISIPIFVCGIFLFLLMVAGGIATWGIIAHRRIVEESLGYRSELEYLKIRDTESDKRIRELEGAAAESERRIRELDGLIETANNRVDESLANATAAVGAIGTATDRLRKNLTALQSIITSLRGIDWGAGSNDNSAGADTGLSEVVP